MPDIFDQVQVESPAKGDIFDTVAPSGPVQKVNTTDLRSQMAKLQRATPWAGMLGNVLGYAERDIEPLTPHGILSQPTRIRNVIEGTHYADPNTQIHPDIQGAVTRLLQEPENLGFVPPGTLAGPDSPVLGAGLALARPMEQIINPENALLAPAFAEDAAAKTAQTILKTIIAAQVGSQVPGQVQQAQDVVQDKQAPVSEKVAATLNPAISTLLAGSVMHEPDTYKPIANKLDEKAFALGPSVQLKAPGARFDVGPKGDIFDALSPEQQPREGQGGTDATTKLRTDQFPQTQPPGDIQKVGKEVRTGAGAQDVTRTETQSTEAPLIVKHQAEQRYGENVIPANTSYTHPETGFTRENVPPGTSEEVIRKQLGEKFARDLVPAIRTDQGILEPDSPDQITHPDILKANGIDPESINHFDPRRGFVDSQGKWYSRKEAERLTGIKGTADAGGLDSTDLPRAKDIESAAEAQPAVAKSISEEGATPALSADPFMVLDPEFWGKLGIGANVKTDAQMLYNRIRNKLGEQSQAWKSIDTDAFRKFVVGSGKISPDEVKDYVEKNGPKVEVRKFGEGQTKQTPKQREFAQLQHLIDTMPESVRDAVRRKRMRNDATPFDKYDSAILGTQLPEHDLQKVNRFLELGKDPESFTPLSAFQSSHWSSIAPKPEYEMPGYTEIAVVKPNEAKNTIQKLQEESEKLGFRIKSGGRITRIGSDIQWDLDNPNLPERVAEISKQVAELSDASVNRFPSSHSFPPNTLGFVRGYMETTPEGKKVFHVIEVQSDWAQRLRDAKETQRRTIQDLGIPAGDMDAERTIRNQDEPLLAQYERLALKAAIAHARSEGADAIAISDAETAMMTEGHDRAHVAHGVSSEFPEPIQAPGMRLHYDRTLPKIAEELTGAKPKRVNFGENKMAVEESDVRHGETLPRKDLIFKEPSGEPKTSITARQFALSNIPQRAPAIMGKLYGGLPIFDPELWGSTIEGVKAMKDKYADYLRKKGETVGADTTLNAASRQFVSKADRAKAILSSTTAQKFNSTQEQIAQPGEKLSFKDKTVNLATRIKEAAAEADKVVNPWDVIYDWLDGGKGKYSGPLMENIRKPLDSDFNDELNLRSQLLDPIRDLITKHKMGNKESGRIGVYLNTLQSGGRDRMVKSGIKPAIIDNIVNSLTPAERDVATEIRKMYDTTFPLIQKVAKEVDKIDLKPVPNYFSWEREWRKYKPSADELASPNVPKQNPTVDDVLWPGLEPVRTRTKPGSLESRIPNAKTPIKVNAFEIVDRYVRDASHYISMRKHLKEISEIVRDEKFSDKYGEKGQELIMEHLNTIARQGRYKRNAFFDTLRRLTSRGVIAFRIPSQLVHLANIPLAQQRTGVGWWHKGLDSVLSDEGQTFLRKNFAETFERGGGEPALREIEEGNLGKQSAYDAFGKAGFWLQRRIDQLNAQATVMGIYMRELKKSGKNPDDFHTLPVDQRAVEQARVHARRAVASPIYKDVPPVVGRGGSVGRSLLQFQNTFLDQWSNFRYDLVHAGIPQAIAGHPKLAMQMTAALFAMLMTETAVKYGYKQALNVATGNKNKESDSFDKTLQHEALRRIPGMGQLESEVVYGETGVPSIDVATGPLKEGYKYLKAEDKGTKALAATRAAADVAEMSGVPGSSQAADVVEGLERKHFFKTHQQRLEEQTKEPVSKMTLSQRIAAERKYKQTAEPISKVEQARSAERSISNITKRGEEVSSELSPDLQKYIKQNSFNVPGYDNKLKLNKTEVYLTDDELTTLHSFIKDEYTKAITSLQRDRAFSKLSANEQKEYFNEYLISARKLARAKLIDQMESKKEMSGSESERDKKKSFSIFNP